jgi:hypothetical protein
MKERFANTMVMCAAIVTFFGGGAAVVSGVSSLVDSRVNTVLVARQQAADAAIAAADAEGVVGSVVNGTKKLIKSLN